MEKATEDEKKQSIVAYMALCTAEKTSRPSVRQHTTDSPV